MSDDTGPGHWCRECRSYAAWFPGASCDQCASKWLPPSPPTGTPRREPEQLPPPAPPPEPEDEVMWLADWEGHKCLLGGGCPTHPGGGR